MASRGVFFIANDRILELALAFLNSFRMHNPEIPLCLIPFRSDVAELEQLQERYRFSVYDDHQVLAICDEVSTLFHPEVTGHYRKLACWRGPFDEFVYIDVDMLVLKNINFVFDLLDRFDVVTSCSNIPEAEKWVWKPSILETGALTPEQVHYAANTGFVASRKGVLIVENLLQRAFDARKLAPHMELYCKEQPFLNYLIVTSGIRYASLWVLMDTPLYPQGYIEYWAGNGRKKLKEGMKTLHNGKLREVFLVHWAGTWQLRKFEIRWYRILNFVKIREKIWLTSIFMPMKKLWNSYRYANPPKRDGD